MSNKKTPKMDDVAAISDRLNARRKPPTENQLRKLALTMREVLKLQEPNEAPMVFFEMRRIMGGKLWDAVTSLVLELPIGDDLRPKKKAKEESMG